MANTGHAGSSLTRCLSVFRKFYRGPVFVQGQFGSGCLCIGISHGQERPTWINGVNLTRNSIQVYAEGADLTYRAGRSTQWAGITITRERLQAEALRQLGHELDLPRTGMRNYEVPEGLSDQLHNPVSKHRYVRLGRFSRDYRIIFGESPSETARRARY